MAIMPLLMFTGKAEEAMRLYVSIIPDSEIIDVERYGSDEDGPEGSIRRATFHIAGQTFMCIDSPVEPDFEFTPSVSFFLDCESESHLDSLFERLFQGGDVLMPIGEYPFSRRFVWFTDRFGVSWQLNVALHQKQASQR
jgi:predicted 3-demethylubiquinone-9 3-methyltransferase (glyoxalase superfamily)